MGTSAKNRGSSSSSPLVPSWLDGGLSDPAPRPPTTPENPGVPPNQATPQPPSPLPLPLPSLPAIGDKDRFRPARIAFNRAVRYGSVRENLGRSLAGYSRRGVGGSSTGARRMGNSSRSAGQILGFAQAVRDVGFQQAADEFGIGDLTGRPLGESVARLTEAFCEPGGSIDEAITRTAWNETLLLAVEQGVEDFESLTAQEWTSLVEIFVARSIEFRVFNDIGNDALGGALNVEQIDAIQADLHDLIFGAVQGKLTPIITGRNRLSNKALRDAADNTYQMAFAYLEALAEE
jgi:hypothetical protein